jgi:hypothetical protein
VAATTADEVKTTPFQDATTQIFLELSLDEPRQSTCLFCALAKPRPVLRCSKPSNLGEPERPPRRSLKDVNDVHSAHTGLRPRIAYASRILDLARVFGIGLRSTSATKKQLAQLLGTQLDGQLPAVLREFGREELTATCKVHGVPAESSSRRELIAALLASAGLDASQSVPPAPLHHHNGLPRAGQIVRARHRQWLVEDVHEGATDESARVTPPIVPWQADAARARQSRVERWVFIALRGAVGSLSLRGAGTFTCVQFFGRIRARLSSMLLAPRRAGRRRTGLRDVSPVPAVFARIDQEARTASAFKA